MKEKCLLVSFLLFNATKISYLRKKYSINNMFPYGNIGKKRVKLPRERQKGRKEHAT